MPYGNEIITEIDSRHKFLDLLKVNPGLILLKLGAEWCGPCKKVDPYVEEFFKHAPENVLCAILDVDENFDLYAHFKASRITNGIPVVMCFNQGNTSGRPDDSVTGADMGRLNEFFKRCGEKAQHLNRSP
jgi:thioredoxin-like negative regulator of GroEL